MQLSEKIAGFIHHLRMNNFGVGTARTLAILQVLSTTDLSNLKTVRASLKIMLCNCKEHWDNFDDLFEAYWFGRGRERSKTRSSSQLSGPAQPKLWQQHLQQPSDNIGGKHVPQIESEQSNVVQGEAAGKLIATRNSRSRSTGVSSGTSHSVPLVQAISRKWSKSKNQPAQNATSKYVPWRRTSETYS